MAELIDVANIEDVPPGTARVVTAGDRLLAHLGLHHRGPRRTAAAGIPRVARSVSGDPRLAGLSGR